MTSFKEIAEKFAENVSSVVAPMLSMKPADVMSYFKEAAQLAGLSGKSQHVAMTHKHIAANIPSIS